MKDQWSMNYYQKEAVKTAIYPDRHKMVYPALGLAGEAGEIANKVKNLFVMVMMWSSSSRRRWSLPQRLVTCYGIVRHCLAT